MNVQDTLFNFIRDHFNIEDDPEYTADVNLFDYGFVDSLGAIEIINFAEETWSIEISQKDLTLYPMNTINEIAIVIEAKLS